jgi:hypothetical protein
VEKERPQEIMGIVQKMGVKEKRKKKIIFFLNLSFQNLSP